MYYNMQIGGVINMTVQEAQNKLIQVALNEIGRASCRERV